MKNEEGRIALTLESLKPFVDRFVICDTGSSDGTVKECEEFLGKGDQTSEILTVPWVDFAQARNTALRAADSGPGWLLMFDCDMRIEGDARAFRASLDCLGSLAASLPTQLGMARFERLCLFKAGQGLSGPGTPEGWHFAYPVHELAQGPGERWRLDAPVLSYEIRDHDRRKVRWEKHDLPAIERFLAKNPKDLRMLFYRAQTLECLRRFPEAIKAYQKRIDVAPGLIHEETFTCLMRIGDCHQAQGLRDGALLAWLKAFEMSPDRAEPLEKISRAFLSQGNLISAWHFAHACAQLPYPREARLFVDSDLYEQRAKNYLTALEGMLRSQGHTKGEISP